MKDTVQRLLGGVRTLGEDEYAEREQGCVEGYEQNLDRPVRALSRARTFAMTLPRHRGRQLVLSGEPERGWPQLERSWLLETLSTHLIGPHIASNAQLLLAYALALGEPGPAQWMATALEARMKRHPDAYEGQFFPRFVLHLHRVYAPQRSAGPGPIPELGPYARVFAAWSDAEALAEALAEVCTYRVETVAAEGADEVTEFRFLPLLPLEVAAVARIRAARGELWIPVVHPVLDTPLGEIPTRRSYDPRADPWYARVVAAGVAAGRLESDFVWPSAD